VRRPAVVFVLLAALAIALTLYLSGPGWLAPDSTMQLIQARSFEFKDDHPVLMALMWHYVDLVVPGPRGMLIIMTVWYWGGLAGLFWALPGPLLARALGCLAVGFYPPVFSSVPVIWKDQLMQAALLMGFACFLLPARRWRWRWLPLLLGVMLFVVAIGARHNAPVAAVPLLAYPLLSSGLLGRWRPFTRWLLATGAALCLCFAIAVGLQKALAPLAEKMEFWQVIPGHDLAGMSLDLNEVLVDPESGLLTKGMGLEQIRYFYKPQVMNPLYWCIQWKGKRCVHVFNRLYDPKKLAILRQNWLREIGRHPGAYLRHRYHVFASLLGIEGTGSSTYYYVNDPPYKPIGADYPLPQRTKKLLSWIERRVHRLWFRPWVYFLLNAVVLPVVFVRYLRGESPLPLQLATSGFLYLAVLFFVTGSSDYRYTVWTTLCTLVAILATTLEADAAARATAALPSTPSDQGTVSSNATA